MYGKKWGSPTPRDKQYINQKSFDCIALCEVINSPGLRKSGDIWVEPAEEHVVTRFFFVYPSNMSNRPRTSRDLHTQTGREFKRQIEKAMSMCYQFTS